MNDNSKPLNFFFLTAIGLLVSVLGCFSLSKVDVHSFNGGNLFESNLEELDQDYLTAIYPEDHFSYNAKLLLVKAKKSNKKWGLTGTQSLVSIHLLSQFCNPVCKGFFKNKKSNIIFPFHNFW